MSSEGQDLVIETASRRAWQGDEELMLSQRQFDLLAFLASHPGEVVSREEIMRQVWQTSWIASTKTVDMHVSWLRRALSDSASTPRYITTIRGVGFRFEEG